MAEGTRPWRRILTAVGAGLIWTQAATALHEFVLPRYLPLSESIARGWSFGIASWTLLAPLTLASQVVAPPGLHAMPTSSLELPAWAFVVSPCVGVGLCLACVWPLGSRRWRRPALAVIALAGLIGVSSGVVVSLECRDAVVAEREFFALLAHVEVAHKDAAVVAGAREFVKQHPNSRWAGEALRIVAMAQWDAGRIDDAAQSWARFASRFHDPTAPGVAYAEYSLALCSERLGTYAAARDHLRRAIETIRARGDGTQAWIATEAATRLAAVERSEGRYAMASYWNEKSQAFVNAYSTE